MSLSIWMQCGGKRNLRPFGGEAWRVVEAQHRISTRRLVDSDAEQALLERLIDGAKPPLPEECAGLHYLLSTPFRHPPLRRGSRFGTRGERSLFYASKKLTTAFAEVAYYRLLFLEGTRAAIEPVVVDLSAFQVKLSTEAAVDLTRAPFDAWEAEISSPTSYRFSQALGREMREDEVELALFLSARDPEKGENLAIFSPSCFQQKRPTLPETWLSVTTREGVECSRRDYFERRSFRYSRSVFEVDGRLPMPSLD